MATIDDVAKLAGVSKATVSRVLNETAPVSEQTRKKIEKAMTELDYAPSLLAQSMRSKKTKTIGIIIPDYANPFYSYFFKVIENKLREYGYMALVCSSYEDAATEIEHIKMLISRQIDGIIYFMYKSEKDSLDFLVQLSRKIPCIFMDNIDGRLPVSRVITDGFKGIKEATEYLLRKGYKRIGCIKGPSRFAVTVDRVNGYKTALQEHNIPIEDELIYEGNFHMESGFKAGEYFLSLPKRPDGIVAVTDLMAIGALKYFQYVGVKIPQQIGVVGFDNISLCTVVNPPLTTIAQPMEELGNEAVKLLMRKINNPRSRNRQIILDGKLIIRRSTDLNEPEVVTI
jgi:DNA-binding LacI/PurR family transcriptional regulator